MWKLWPSAWLSHRKSTIRRHAEIVEALNAEWRSRLAAALGRVLSVEINEEAAPARLDGLTGEELLALDSALRLRQWAVPGPIPPSPGNPVAPVWPDSDAASRYLFVAASDGNGFIRQEALKQFRLYPSRLALAAALIRMTDWVPQVQTDSEALLSAFSGQLPPTLWIDLLDLLVALRRRQRFRESVWQDQILPMLRAPESRDRRWRWATEGSWRVRLFALSLIVDDEPTEISAALRVAITSEELPVALWGIAFLSRAQGVERIELLALAAAHPAACARAAAVRATATLEAESVRHLLLNAIFDPASGPRSAAAREFEHRLGQSARVLWRQALADKESVRWKGALLGLCDSPEAEDIPLITQAVEYRIAAVRCAGLRGLARIGAPTLQEYLNRALTDESKAVVRQSLELFRYGAGTLEPTVLLSSLRSSTDATRGVLMRGTRLLGKWEGLDLLLHIYPDVLMRESATEEIAHWLTASNRRFTSPSSELLLRIQDALAKLSQVLPEPVAAPLQDVLKRA